MKTLFPILSSLCLAASVMGQGQINFTSGTNLVKYCDGTPVPVNSGFVQLLWAPSGTPVSWPRLELSMGLSLWSWLDRNPGWQSLETSISPINGPIAGRFLAGALDIGTPTPGGTIDAIVVAWTGNYRSFDLALASPDSKLGVSDMFTIDTGNPQAQPIPELPASTAGVFPGITMVCIPEPTIVCFGALAFGILLVRYHKRKGQ